MSEEMPTPQPAASNIPARRPAKKKKAPAKAQPVPRSQSKETDYSGMDEDTAERMRMSDSLRALKTMPKVKIMISSTETQKEDVKWAINGHVFQIPRDMECEVPEAVANGLLDCKITTYRQQKRADGEEGMEMIPIEVSRFPVSIRR